MGIKNAIATGVAAILGVGSAFAVDKLVTDGTERELRSLERDVKTRKAPVVTVKKGRSLQSVQKIDGYYVSTERSRNISPSKKAAVKISKKEEVVVW